MPKLIVTYYIQCKKQKDVCELKVVVTGKAGFISSHLFDAFILSGVSTAKKSSINELFKLLADINGINMQPLHTASPDVDIKHSCLFNKNAHQGLYWDPIVKIQKGMNDTHAFIDLIDRSFLGPFNFHSDRSGGFDAK
ncbi:hypothetical protein MHH33_04775 [Paenisporosarcina sp. FSL H8-0542]|uniref:hypothetical protein n=1 Tax=Paenisporosarcina sp. FSL H8-0542 TaxID=2921401 RepID=UPI00315A1F9C